MSVEKITPNYLKKSGFDLPYTIILNETIDLIPDNSAMGVYLYLARKPENWVIQEKDLMNRFSKGRDHIRACLAILKKTALYKKESIRDEQGHITHWESTLYAQVTENPSYGGVNHIPENPTSGKTHLLDNPTHTKERGLKKKELNTNGEPCSPAVGISQSITPLELATVFAEELPDSPQPVIHAVTKALDSQSRRSIIAFKQYWKEKNGYELTVDLFRAFIQEMKENAPGFFDEYTNKGCKKKRNGITAILNWENYEKYLNGTLF